MNLVANFASGGSAQRKLKASRILFSASFVVWGKVRPFMRTILVRYKTSEASADSNAALVRAVFEELRARAPRGLHYASYRLADSVTFVHIATLETRDDNPLAALPTFKAFQAELRERCVEPPVIVELTVVGSYGLAA
jgi:hypothetical protein